MSSTNISGRPPGSISIPIEIIPASKSNFYSRRNPPLHTTRNDYPYSDFTNSPPSKKPTINSYSNSRFQPRQSPTNAYDRLIKHSQLNQPLNDHPVYKEPSSFYCSRSNEDLLSSPMNSKHSNNQPKTNGFRLDSDFIQPHKQTNSLRRSFDALNDFPPTYIDQTSNNSNKYRVPTNHNQGTFNNSHDRSRSPASQRDESPTRPPPPSAQQQQQYESDFKIPKDATGSLPSTSSSSQLNDQQVPSTDPNIIALEKLEQIKQNLANFNQQVDTFIGSTRDDRIYKELDEQALKIMLRCDELIDVSADIKEKRKEMIQNVQTVLAKLESKVPINPAIESNSNVLVIYDPSNQQNEETSIEQST